MILHGLFRNFSPPASDSGFAVSAEPDSDFRISRSGWILALTNGPTFGSSTFLNHLLRLCE